MSNEIVSKESRAPIKYAADGGVTPATFEEAYRMANMFAASDLVPKDYRGKPENCMVAMQMGAEIGLKPMQSLQGIAVINGRPAIWGDALWSLVQSSPLVSDCEESFDDSTMTARCSIQRRGRAQPTVATFSKADAEKAGLWNKDGPWKGYSKRMLQMRARAFAARDAVPDVLKGLCSAEEARDIVEVQGERVDAPLRSRTEQLKERLRKPAPESVDTETGEVRSPVQLIETLSVDAETGEIQANAPTLDTVRSFLRHGEFDTAEDIARSLPEDQRTEALLEVSVAKGKKA